MTKSQYQTALQKVLSDHSVEAVRRLQSIVDMVPPQARALDIEIFPGQDNDGMFSVRASLDGPDLYTLNKALNACADIFGVKATAYGLEPVVPTVDQHDLDFDVNDALVDCAAQWIQSLSQETSIGLLMVPVRVIGHDGYGTITPVLLKP